MHQMVINKTLIISRIMIISIIMISIISIIMIISIISRITLRMWKKNLCIVFLMRNAKRIQEQAWFFFNFARTCCCPLTTFKMSLIYIYIYIYIYIFVVPCFVILDWRNPTRCKSMHIFIYCYITLHVSGVHCAHHQEYIKL